MVTRVEQLLHGYRRGHERLAGSIKLDSRDSDLVGRLSDLSGTLSGSIDFAPYLTAYPLPSGTYYALAQTWPDNGAPRSGCVMTHTLLVPMSSWERMSEPSALAARFRFPEDRTPDTDYETPLQITDSRPVAPPVLEDAHATSVLDFVQRFFGDGTKPIVWFGHKQPSAVAWLLIRGLWPKTRGRFSVCTSCLQPRTLEDRMFDLMFAPAEAFPRFIKLGDSHFIDDSITDSRLRAPVEDWCREWAEWLFASGGDSQEWADLWNELDDEPTAIRKLFLIQSMARTASLAPQAAVGKMDLLESVAREPDAGLEIKRRTAEAAIHFAVSAPVAGDGLESLRLIEDRLRRSAYSGAAATLGPELQQAVSALLGRHPELAGHAIESAEDLGDLDDSWFGRGILDGLASISVAGEDFLLVLNDLPLTVVRALTTRHDLFASYTRGLLSRHNRDGSHRNRTIEWLESAWDSSSRSQIRLIAREVMLPSDAELVSITLKGLPESEVGATLDWLTGDQRASDGVNRICDHVAGDYPGATQAWARQTSRWDEDVARVASASVPRSRQGLQALLTDAEFPDQRMPLLIAAYLERLARDRFPHWLVEFARERPTLLNTLLGGISPAHPLVSWAIDRLLAAAPEIPVIGMKNLAAVVAQSRGQPFGARLVDGLMRGSITAYISDEMDEATARDLWETQEGNSWLAGAEPFELKAMVTRCARSSTRQWIRAWDWLANSPSSLYARQRVVLPELIEALVRVPAVEWSPAVTALWVRMLKRSKEDGCSRRTHLLLSVQALDFAFRHDRLPLSRLVVESFAPVYSAVTTSSSLPPETAPLFGVLDWDKGKELRRDLLDAFFYTQWPPGDLALATGDVRLLRKIFKRLLRKSGGHRYAEMMLADLSSRPPSEARPFVGALASMLDDPGFYEEWE